MGAGPLSSIVTMKALLHCKANIGLTRERQKGQMA
jgi:hypothetical protein